jgi:hypothetical protein
VGWGRGNCAWLVSGSSTLFSEGTVDFCRRSTSTSVQMRDLRPYLTRTDEPIVTLTRSSWKSYFSATAWVTPSYCDELFPTHLSRICHSLMTSRCFLAVFLLSSLLTVFTCRLYSSQSSLSDWLPVAFLTILTILTILPFSLILYVYYAHAALSPVVIFALQFCSGNWRTCSYEVARCWSVYKLAGVKIYNAVLQCWSFHNCKCIIHSTIRTCSTVLVSLDNCICKTLFYT